MTATCCYAGPPAVPACAQSIGGWSHKSHQSPPAVPALDGTLGPVHLRSPFEAGVHLLQLHVGLDCDVHSFPPRPSKVGHIIKSINSNTFLHQIIVLDLKVMLDEEALEVMVVTR